MSRLRMHRLRAFMSAVFLRLAEITAGRPCYLLDLAEVDTLVILARRAGRRPQEMARDLILRAIAGWERQGHNWQRWQSLSPREQQVAALICQDLTSPQIARRLGVSTYTVESHAEHILKKFGLPNRHELRKRLVDWEF